VWAVEIDDALVERLRQARWSAAPGFQLIHGDILTVRLDHILPSAKCKLVGNLPYSIATPVLFRLFEWRACFSSLVLMVQKELADRIVSGPGSKDYGALSLWSQVHGQVSEKITVSPEAFFPRPKVRSTVLKIDLLAEPLIRTADRGAFSGLVRAVFDQRRKTLSNNLTAWLKRGRTEIDDFLWSCDIDPKRRGETLSVAEFINLAGRVNQYGFLSFDR
jgi:16S rRNA (adenine1518-N6/adenine1519-N6)-dimethyltransferase